MVARAAHGGRRAGSDTRCGRGAEAVARVRVQPGHPAVCRNRARHERRSQSERRRARAPRVRWTDQAGSGRTRDRTAARTVGPEHRGLTARRSRRRAARAADGAAFRSGCGRPRSRHGQPSAGASRRRGPEGERIRFRGCREQRVRLCTRALVTRRYVVLGNGIAGQTCAEDLRQADPDASIVIIAAERHPLYNRVALPRYLRGQVRREKVFMRTVEDYAKRNIEIHFETWATDVDLQDKIVLTNRGQELKYDAILIATGGRSKPPPWPGSADVSACLGFQTLDDTDAIIEKADSVERVLVMGGSFIGYELAEGVSFRQKAKVTWIMRGPWFLRYVLDEEGGKLCHQLGEAQGNGGAPNMAGADEAFFDVPTYTTTMFGSTLGVMGGTPDVHPGLESVRTCSLEEKFYRKLFFKDDRLVGAIMIGPPKGRKKLIEIMRSRQKIERPKQELLDPANLKDQ